MDRDTGHRRTRRVAGALLAALLLPILLTAFPGSGDALEAGSRERSLRGSGISRVPDTIRVLMPDGTVETMEMDDYLKGVVPSEVSPSWSYDSLAAQAVAARSFAATAHRHPEEGADV